MPGQDSNWVNGRFPLPPSPVVHRLASTHQRSPLCDANVLRTMHSNSLSSASRKIKSRAHPISDPPRSPVIDPDSYGTAIMRICYRQCRPDRPTARRCSVAIRIKSFATRSAPSRRIWTRQKLMSCAFARWLYVLMDWTPSRGIHRLRWDSERNATRAQNERPRN